MSDDAILELSGVVAGYGRGPDILRGVNLKVEPQKVTCIIGPNGAGKSTLLKVIIGLLRPRDGEVLLEGQRINRLRPDQILRKGVCFVPQERSLFPDMTVRENLKMGGYVMQDRGAIAHRIDEVFEIFPDLKAKRRQHARELSGGQQQMLAMGRALVLQPKVILLDEPSLGLAPQLVERVFEIISHFKERGMTVLLVEQNAHKGLEFADWGCVLDLGKTVFEGDANGILGDPRIQELYLGTRKQAAIQESTV
jgi:branched-chain amino acid transport system ATP-binding protein